MPTPAVRPLRLALLLYEGCMPAGLFAAADLARAANLRTGRPLFEVQWVGLAAQPVPTWQGPALLPTASLDRTEADALLVPGLWLSSPAGLRGQLQPLQPLVQALAGLPRSTQLWSYCAGVLLLAASGRLDGQPATATWWLQSALEQEFPAVAWRFDEPLVAQGRYTTAAGANGHLPLMLHALSQRLPSAAVQDLQEVLMLPRPRTSHAAFAGVDLMSQDDPALRGALLWVQRQPAQGLTLASLAAAMHLSTRTLARRVHSRTGLSAAHWMRRIKLRQASEALCQTRHPLKRIAQDLGFASEAGLHRAFTQATGQTPLAYRMAHGQPMG
jgi:transcriptional regulator GlxA family with amidase domain